MYDPKYDLPLAVGLSLAVSLIATYVTADNTLNPQRFVGGALSSNPVIVDCEREDGTLSPCPQIVTVGVPADATVDPSCPETNDAQDVCEAAAQATSAEKLMPH